MKFGYYAQLILRNGSLYGGRFRIRPPAIAHSEDPASFNLSYPCRLIICQLGVRE